MAIKSDREYRNLGAFEAFEKSDEEHDEESFLVRGYASTFEPYLMFEDNGVQFFEQIEPTAFEHADMSDVVFLRDHTGAVLARTKNGAITLSTDAHGLLTVTDLGLTEASRDMFKDIKVGNYSQMSFSFVVEKEHFEEPTKNMVVRHVDAVKKIYDISAVGFPANPTTNIGVSYRSLFDGVINQREAERLKAIRDRQILALKIKLMRGK